MTKNKNGRRKKAKQKEILYGYHPIAEMLKARKRNPIVIYVSQKGSKSFDKLKPLLKGKKVPIYKVDKSKLSGIAGSPEHMGVVALVSPFRYRSKMFEPQKQRFILLLDGIQDVGNLGAILRSAYCTGVEGIILCRKGGALLTPAVFKASAGLAEHLDIYVTPTIQVAVEKLKAAGYFLYLTVVKDGKDATKVKYAAPLCLVIGNEATGITKNILNKGIKVTLPQRNSEISYNASVAAGIFLFLVSQKISR